MTDPNFIGPPAPPPAGGDGKDSEVLAAILVALNKLNGTNEKGNKDRKPATKGTIAQAKAIPLVGKAVKLGSDQITAAVNDAKKIHKAALGRGQTLGKIAERANIGLADSLGSNIASSDKLALAQEQSEAGMSRSTAAVTQLGLYTKLTGGNSKKLMKSFQELGAGMSFSDDQRDKLSNSLVSLSQGFEMTTDELMNSIRGLEKSMPMYKILGIGPEIAEATARLGAALGQESGKMASEMMTTLLSAEGAILASQLGVMEERNALLKGEKGATQTSLKMVAAAGEEADRMYKSFLRGSGDPAIAYKAVTDALGPGMQQSAQVYKQLANQADNMNMSLDDYIEHVGEQKDISNKFTAQFDNLVNTIFSPLYGVMVEMMHWANLAIAWLQQSPVLVALLQGIALLTAAVLALVAAMASRKLMGGMKEGLKTLWKSKGKYQSAASSVADKVTGAGSSSSENVIAGGRKRRGGGMGGGIGKLLTGIGKGMAGLGKGMGKMVQGLLTGVAKGVGAFGKPMVLKGALGILAVGAAFVPLAFALSLMKGVGYGTILKLAAALLVFGAAAFGLGALIGSGAGLVLFTAGVIGIAALGVALLPLAAAAYIAAPGLLALAVAFKYLAGVSIMDLLLLGPALVGISIGMAALGAGGLVSGLLSWLTPGDGPVEKIVKMGKASVHLNKLARSLRIIPKRLYDMVRAMKNIKVEPFTQFSKGLDKVGSSIGKIDEGKLKGLAQLMAKGSALSMSERISQAEIGPYANPDANFATKKPRKLGEGASVQEQLDRERQRKQYFRMKEARGAAAGRSGRGDMNAGRMQAERSQRVIDVLTAILERQGEQVDQGEVANKQRQGGQKMLFTRSTNLNLPPGTGIASMK